MTAHELTDPDGDGLTLTIDSRGIWITATDGSGEVTVGPYDPRALRSIVVGPHLVDAMPPESARRVIRPRDHASVIPADASFDEPCPAMRDHCRGA